MKFLALLFFVFVWTLTQSAKEVKLTCGDDDETERGAISALFQFSTGLPGIKGEKGDVGIPGKTDDAMKDIVKLETKIQDLERKLEQQSELISQLQEFQHSHTDKVKLCYAGLKDRRIANGQMSASSSYPHPVHAPWQARLDNNDGWAPANRRPGAWLQIDFRSPIVITGVITQGRKSPIYIQWVTGFKISYGNSLSQLQFIFTENGTEKVFQANRDQNSLVTNKFPKPIVARYLRLVVDSYHEAPVFRIEVLTC